MTERNETFRRLSATLVPTIGIVGAACRLPGAADEAAFRALLAEGRSAVRPAPEGRWNVARHLHPARNTPGYAYSFAGGYLDAPFAFDTTVFGLSPREAAQMDPQQRLLLEVVWDALGNAEIPPASLARTEVGVYVGGSSLDHGNIHAADPASIDSHFMTGNTLSILANRISHVFDLRGPSFTVDTACSSSLVAFARAVADLEAGRVETAIVAGVNLLLSPFSFVGFSRASMLSQTGLCRPFSADGDGYVRSEGAVALVLTRTDHARPGALRATVEAADVNSDGHTSGIALPGLDGQTALLTRIYRDLDADAIAFVEAHGTGTRVGDPIEAEALGRALGRRRSRPLPIGSVKSNIGHLEPASGVAGLMKALIALETRVLPASLHLEALHPDIDFEGLGLAPARAPVTLPAEPETLVAGVSSFGFGGTNAHVVLRGAPKAPVAASATETTRPTRLVVSAASREALRAGAKAVAERLEAGIDARRLAAALAAGRDPMEHRAVVALDADDLAGALAGFAAEGRHGDVEEGVARGRDAGVCLVYSGNGAQWAGMGRVAFARNAAFRARFEEVSATFATLSDRSLVDDLHDPELAEKMRFGAFLQPILFGLQTATTASLVAAGVRPTMVVGHSIGELAAATDAGAIGLEDALRIVVARSACQEAVHGRGTMAVFAAGRDAVADLLAALGRDDVEIAADNGPSSVTISGATEAVALAVREGRRRRIASRTLDIEYPFHSRFVEGLRERMLETLGPIAPRPASISVISTVTGEPIGDRLLDADHWWWNVRAPVRFREAIGRAAALGAGLFVEIGPRPILQSPIADTLRDAGSAARTVATLAEADDRRPEADPIARVVARLVANGATLCEPEAPPPPVDRTLGLPSYAWQRREHRFAHTSERLDVFGEEAIHPLIGARLAQGQHEWRTRLDARLQPWLADHLVEGEVVVPAAAIAEMILAVGRDLEPEGPLAFEDLDVLVPLTLPADGMRELSIRHAEATGAVEIWSRLRFGPDEWSLNARARLAAPTAPRRPPAASGSRRDTFATDAIYAAAATFGLDYGPAFRLARACDRRGDTMTVETRPATPIPLGQGLSPLLLHPASLDAALHPLFCFVDADPASRETHLPVGIARLVLHRTGAEVAAANVRVERETENTLTVAVHLFDARGEIVAEADGVHMRRVVLEQRAVDDVCFRVELCRRERAAPLDPVAVIGSVFAGRGEETADEARLMLRAHMLATAHRALARIADADGRLDIGAAVLAGRLSPEAAGWVGRMAEVLAEAGLADLDAGGFRLAAETGLPDPEPILATFAAEFPAASDELLHAARTAAEVDGFLAEGLPPGRGKALKQAFEAMPLLSAAARRSLDAALHRLMAAAGDVPPRLLIAQSHARRILALLLGHVQRTGMRVTVAGTDRTRLERLAARLPVGSGIDVLDLSTTIADGPRFDVAVMVASHCRDDDLLEKMAGRVVDDGALVVFHPMDDGLIDFWFGMADAWFAGSLDPHLAIGGVCPIGDARRRMDRLGCDAVGEHVIGAPDEIALIGRVAPRPAKPAATPLVRILDEDSVETGLLAAVRDAFAARGGRLADADTSAERIRLFAHATGDDRRRAVAALETLRADLLAGAPRLAVVLRTGTGAARDPVCDAIRGFLRVALNEHPGTRIRVLDLDPTLDDAAAGEALADWLVRDDGEADTTITTAGAFVPRVRRGLPAATDAETASEALEAVLPRRGALEHFTWRPKPRRAPGLGEIEVEVIATGLNFRDVMLAMGLLDEGDVADGLAGADYGFECVGRVVALGEGAARFRPGDVVLGFAPRAFASHVTGPADVFVPAPEGIEPTAAATVPVAFVTAWYGLVECARLKPGEVVLVHGAAGGVGLAALQVARSLGARVVATVSTQEKRALARLFGAETILDSRSLDFVDAVRKDLGGVDVVLNSLSGDAMRAGVKCLKPFGRFVELGKRDYVANTELALRPFRRNLTYHGVDVDQLLAHDPSIVARGFAAIAEGFRDGRFSALPHRLFEADEIGEAFRLMQAAGHVGKILVRPPVPGTRRLPPAPKTPFAPGDGVQLVVGGTGGFGFATALHLADRGARRIVVASRSGRLEDGAAEKVAALAARGIDLRVETVDAADLASVEALVARTARDVGPIAGVWLTAMVLDDGLLADLDATRIDRVLAPKVAGAVNLDRATRGQPVETFVLFSSAAALVGSPGQAAYAAANAFVEGIARRRRAEGLPALAVAWGAIADVGVLAREGATAARLERVTGVAGFRAREALARLDDLLARADRFDDPVICCAGFRKVGALRDLALLATPAFEDFLRGDGESEEGETDLATLIDGKSDGEAMKILCDIVAGEVARILRLAPSEVDVGRPLDELGLDSLMALELRMNVESRFGVELPLVAITSVKNLHDLARRLLQSLRGGDTAEEGRLDAGDESLVAMHGGDGEAFAGLSTEIEARRKRLEGRT